MPLFFSQDMGGWPDLNGLPMVTPCMHPLNLELLWTTAGLDIENVSLHGEDGDLEREPFETAAVYGIEMLLCGDVDHAGNPTSSIGAGLFANHRAIALGLKKSAWPTPRSCTTTVMAPDGTELTGNVQPVVSQLGRADGGGKAVFLVTVTIPTGELVEA